MSTASDRIQLVGLSLADAHKISDELRQRTLDLREDVCKWQAGAQAHAPGSALWEAAQAVVDALQFERARCLGVREALSEAIGQTLNGL